MQIASKLTKLFFPCEARLIKVLNEHEKRVEETINTIKSVGHITIQK